MLINLKGRVHSKEGTDSVHSHSNVIYRTLASLLQNALVAICPMKPPQPPHSRNYDPNAKCEYHGEVVGHSIENCRQFKYKVQQLIDAGWLTFQEDKPNVEKNPFSNHASPSTNAI